MSLVATILLVLATIVAAYTGDWSLPGIAAAIMLFILLRTLLIVVFIFWPILIAIIMVWTGYKVLFKKKSSERQSSEESPKQV